MTDEYPQFLERLLNAPATGLRDALTYSANVIADALHADKVDAFLYDESRDSLVAVGVSTQPLSELQQRLGLHVLPVSNGGRAVHVFRTGRTFSSGEVSNDPEELRGIREGLKIQSQIGIPLEVAGHRRGLVMIASLEADHFAPAEEAFAESVMHWIGIVAHRAELVEELERNAVEQGRRDSAEGLVTVLAHDLRNYLSPVVSRLYLLRHRAEAEDRTEDLTSINAALQGLSDISSRGLTCRSRIKAPASPKRSCPTYSNASAPAASDREDSGSGSTREADHRFTRRRPDRRFAARRRNEVSDHIAWSRRDRSGLTLGKAVEYRCRIAALCFDSIVRFE